MANKLVVFFSDCEPGSTSEVGGKGVNLIALTRAGFPVPPGFVVTTEAYRRFSRAAGPLVEEVSKFDYSRPDRLREQCLSLKKRLSAVRLPEVVCEATRKALGELARTDGGGGIDDAFAARSSSSFEDLAQASFAGLHETYLNVRGADGIIERVRDCFVSLWNERAVVYRWRGGFSDRAALMAVVVQRQVECDVAGVGFSIHPVSGRADLMVIEANYGIGESVVSGDFDVDHFVLNKATLEVVERRIAEKDRMIALTGTGTRELSVPAIAAANPCLSDGQVQAVGRLLQRVESHFGLPQDIEWGWKGSALYLFQARPVTTAGQLGF